MRAEHRGRGAAGMEQAIPEAFSRAADGSRHLLRLLDNFSLHDPGRPHLLVPLEALKDRQHATIVATGEVVQPNPSGPFLSAAGGGRVPVTTGPVLDWCLEFGDHPAVWIITAAAWYRLLQPSSTYSSSYASIQTKFDLSVRCWAALCLQPSAAVDVVQQSVLSGQQLGGSSSRSYGMQQLMGEIQFLAGQMKTLQRSGAFTQAGAAPSSIPFLDWLNYQAAFAASTAAAADGAAADGPAAKRRRISEASGIQGSAAAAAVPATAGAPGAFKPGNKLKIKFKPSQGAAAAGAAAEPSADRGSQVQGALPAVPSSATAAAPAAAPQPPAATAPAAPAAPAAAAAALAAPVQLHRQPSVVSQLTAGTTGQSQRGPLVKTKIKFTLPKGPRPGAAAAAAAAAAPAAAAAAAGMPQHAPGGAFVQEVPPAVPAWDSGYSQQAGAAAAPRHQQQRLSATGSGRISAQSARAAAASSRAAEAQARKAAREREAQLKREARAQADAARGPPPPPSRSYRLPAWAVGEVLTLWELCQCFGAALQLPSFGVELLEAALLPGPLDADEKATTAAALAAAADAQAAKERTARAAAAAEAAAAARAAAGTAAEGVQQQEKGQEQQQHLPEGPNAPDQKQQGNQQQPQQQQNAGAAAAAEIKQEPQQQQQQQESTDAMDVDASAVPEGQTGTAEAQQQQRQQVMQQGDQQPGAVKQEPKEAAAGAVEAAAGPTGAAADPVGGGAAAAAAPTAVKQEGVEAAPQQQQQAVTAHDMPPPPPQQQQQQQGSQPPAPTASGSTCTGSVAPTASNTSMGTGTSTGGKNLKIKVKLGKVKSPAAAVGAGGGEVDAAAAAAAAAGQQQQQLPHGIDAAAAAAMGIPAAAAAAYAATHPAAGQQDPQQQQQQGGTAWMAQAQAAALAAAAAVSAAAIEPANADTDAAASQHPAPQQQQQQQQDSIGITDAACLPSSLLLRDIHMGLMRLMDGTGPKAGKRGLKPPAVARLCPTESQRQLQTLLSAPHWSHKAAQVVMQSGPLVTGPEPQEAAKQLLQSDYALLSLEPRLAILRCLTDFGFVSELARAHLDARNDAYAQARTSGKPGFAASTFSTTTPAAVAGAYGFEGAAASGDAAAEHATAVRMLEEWVDWVELHSHQAALSTEPIPTIGLRRPLGSDVRRRRYWVLGGAAGAWRVFCEETDTSNWGYYEGAQLLELTSWLAAAGLEAEAPLVAALCSLPWPYKPSLVSKAAKAAATAAAASAGVPEPQSPNSFSYWAGFAGGHLPGSTAGALGQFGTGPGGQALGFTAAQAGVQPGGDVLRPLGLQLPHKRQLMAPSEMQRYRPNGYLGLVAPALYGEADIPGGSILSTTDERLRLGFDCLMAQLPFWLSGQIQVVNKLVAALEHLNSAQTASAYTQALLQLESAMSADSLGPHSPLEPDWQAHWRDAWVTSLSGVQPPSWEAVALHLSMMGRHVVPRQMRMSREAFLTTVEGSRCKLGFPAVGEVVCLVRSGCLLHLRHYAQLPDHATAPLPPPAAELNAAAEVVKTLPPVSKYKVVAVAYCQYPKPTPPPVQQQQQLEPAGSAQLGQNTAATTAAAEVRGVANNVQQGQGQQGVQTGPGVSQQQQQQRQQQSQGASKGSSKKRRSKSYSTGWGYEDEFEDDRSEGESDESESNSEDDEYNDRNIRLTGIDSDADAFGSKQQASGSQSVQQAPSQQQQANGDTGAPGSQATTQQQQQQPVVQQRPPCMWVLLSPINAEGANGGSGNGTQPKAAPAQQSAPTPSPPPGVPEEDQLEDFFGDHLQAPEPVQQQKQRQKLPCLAVPLHIDSGLPDYLVQPSVYDASLQRRWLPQDRCSMFIGNRQRGALGGVSADDFAQGTIIEIEEALPGEEYDPWQSITVLWDDDWSHLKLRSKVCPWDVDTDVEERLRQEEAAKKAAAAAAAAEELARQEAAAEAARQKRRQNQRARLDQIGDIGVAAAERDDDDDYNPEEESDDSEGGRRGRKARLAKQQAQQQAAVTSQLPGAQQPFGDPRLGKKGGRGAGGRGRGPGLTWSASGRGGRGPGGPLAPPCGMLWTREQIEQSQKAHLLGAQRSMLDAAARGDQAALQQTASGTKLPAPLSLDVLCEMPAELEFLILVAAYQNSKKPGFVPPTVNNREIDLYTLFMVVNVRGGYESVCTSFRWGDVCKCVGCDQSHQTITAVRIAYERSLLEFEQYVRTGRYKHDRVQDLPPQWVKEDTAAAMDQCRRAGEAAAKQPQGPTGPLPAAVGPRGPLPLVPGTAGAAGLVSLPGSLPPGVQLLQQGNVALAQAQAQAQLVAQLRLQQQAQILAAQKAGRPVASAAAAGLVRPVQAAGQPQNAAATLQQQQMLLQAQLAANPQLRALLLQQQQQQAQLAAAAAAAGGIRPAGAPAAAASGVLTLAQVQQLQHLQQQQLQQRVGAAGAVVPQQAAAVAAVRPAAAALAGTQPASSQPPPSAGNVNFSAMLGS